MKMLLPLALFLVAPLALLVLAGGGGDDADFAQANADIAQLVPDNCGALIRLRSLDAVTDELDDLGRSVGFGPSADLRSMLYMLDGMAGDTDLIASDRPIALAVALKRATPPSPILIVPTTDADAYQKTLPASSVAPARAGDYVAVPMGRHYERSTDGAALMAKLPEATLAVHGDIEELTEGFGAVIGLGLSTFEKAMSAAIAESEEDLDGEAIAELYVGVARAVLSSGDTMELGVDIVDGLMKLDVAMVAKPDSEMSGWSAPAADLSGCTGGFDAEGSLEALFVADWKSFWPRYEVLLDGLATMYPPEQAEAMIEISSGYKKVFQSLGPVTAVSGSLFGEQGVDVLMNMRSSDAEGVAAGMSAAMQSGLYDQLGIRFTADEPIEADGVQVTNSALSLDWDKFAALGGQIDSDAPRAMVEAMFGSDRLPMTVAAKGERVTLAVGQDAPALAPRTVDADGGAWSPEMQAAIERLGRCNPLLIERVDMGELMGMAARSMGGPAPPGDLSADVLFYAGIEADTWRLGMTIDFAGMMKMMAGTRPR